MFGVRGGRSVVDEAKIICILYWNWFWLKIPNRMIAEIKV
jgi:hypothetical protein